MGRALLGGAESFIITGGVTWGLALAGPANAGRVIAWVGMAMFAALSVGAPFGTALYNFAGFASIGIATVLIPLAPMLLIPPSQRSRRAVEDVRTYTGLSARSGCRASAQRSAASALVR